jgi:hypothetical protein
VAHCNLVKALASPGVHLLCWPRHSLVSESRRQQLPVRSQVETDSWLNLFHLD